MKSLVCLIVVLLCPTLVLAQANDTWFEATPMSLNSSVQDQGLGRILQLGCDVNVAPTCFWNVKMMFKNNSGDRIMGWATDLYTPSNSVHMSVVPNSWSYVANSFAYHQSPLVSNGPSPYLLRNPNGADLTFQGVAGGPYQLGSFTLVESLATNQSLEVVAAKVGDAEWYDDQNWWPELRAGSNPAVIEAMAGTELGTVITIQNTPEPTSLFLLAFGTLAVIRRRR